MKVLKYLAKVFIPEETKKECMQKKVEAAMKKCILLQFMGSDQSIDINTGLKAGLPSKLKRKLKLI